MEPSKTEFYGGFCNMGNFRIVWRIFYGPDQQPVQKLQIWFLKKDYYLIADHFARKILTVEKKKRYDL